VGRLRGGDAKNAKRSKLRVGVVKNGNKEGVIISDNDLSTKSTGKKTGPKKREV